MMFKVRNLVQMVPWLSSFFWLVFLGNLCWANFLRRWRPLYFQQLYQRRFPRIENETTHKSNHQSTKKLTFSKEKNTPHISNSIHPSPLINFSYLCYLLELTKPYTMLVPHQAPIALKEATCSSSLGFCWASFPVVPGFFFLFFGAAMVPRSSEQLVFFSKETYEHHETNSKKKHIKLQQTCTILNWTRFRVGENPNQPFKCVCFLTNIWVCYKKTACWLDGGGGGGGWYLGFEWHKGLEGEEKMMVVILTHTATETSMVQSLGHFLWGIFSIQDILILLMEEIRLTQLNMENLPSFTGFYTCEVVQDFWTIKSTIQETGIFTYVTGWFFMANEGKYTSLMDPLGESTFTALSNWKRKDVGI